MTLRFWETLVHGSNGLRCYSDTLLHCADPSAKVEAHDKHEALSLFVDGYDDAQVRVCRGSYACVRDACERVQVCVLTCVVVVYASTTTITTTTTTKHALTLACVLRASACVQVTKEMQGATLLSVGGIDCWIYIESYIDDV